MTSNHKYVILGGGIVAGYAAREFAKKGIAPNDLAIVSADDTVPYERPPLSKTFLAGEEKTNDLLINDQSFYEDNQIKLYLSTPIAKIDTANSELHTDDGDHIGYEKLLIATGSEVNTLTVTGHDLDGVEYLRYLDDAKSIRDMIGGSKNAVVLGGGYIGMEVAAILAQEDLEVTMVFPNDRLMEENFFTPEISAFFQQYFKDRSVQFIMNDVPTRIGGDDSGHVTEVMLKSGTLLKTDLVVAGIGVSPAVSLFENTTLDFSSRGVITDVYLRSNIDNIYAAGDVAFYRDVLFDKQRQVGHWENAKAQGQYAAQRMLGADDGPFIKAPYFFSDVFDLSYEFWGETGPLDEVVYRGAISPEGFSAWWLRDGRVVGAFVMNRPDEERELAREWIEGREAIPPNVLSDTTVSLKDSKVKI